MKLEGLSGYHLVEARRTERIPPQRTEGPSMSSSSSKKIPNYLKPTLSQSSRLRSPEKNKIIPKLFTKQSIPDQPFFTASLETSPEEEYHHHQSSSHPVSSSSESSLQASPFLQKAFQNSPDQVKPKHSKPKMGHTKVRSFKGLKDGKEDPQEFLEDLEWSYLLRSQGYLVSLGASLA